jgi:hypothetical protein
MLGLKRKPSALQSLSGFAMNNRLVAVSLVMFGTIVFVSSAQAQRHGAFATSSSNRTGRAIVRGGGLRTGFVHRRPVNRSFASSGFGPYFYPEYDSEPGTDELSPQIIAAGRPLASVPSPPEALVLELHGDHWMRITNYGQSQTGGQSSQTDSEPVSNLPSATPRRIPAAEARSELPTAVLVFRDGHKEEIGKYVIIGATICTSANYWSSGSWTRKVQIVELDIPATLKLNQERGAKFSLPSGPNEVMIRP